ncbi:hypothetical protein LX16_1449 [Stackebrandtia albiflava]|uniref:Uncharacterized protein n=1 Tax=Stackebrandtia albiflava TaxID=406432 RepID=A0A562VD01_9ACTN|nr:hypothetical protein [Stackebrandtia albiflava]TWJ15735.1 hypothetical protein LX16_1449 [Stackebrandtia albiflava]
MIDTSAATVVALGLITVIAAPSRLRRHVATRRIGDRTAVGFVVLTVAVVTAGLVSVTAPTVAVRWGATVVALTAAVGLLAYERNRSSRRVLRHLCLVVSALAVTVMVSGITAAATGGTAPAAAWALTAVAFAVPVVVPVAGATRWLPGVAAGPWAVAVPVSLAGASAAGSHDLTRDVTAAVLGTAAVVAVWRARDLRDLLGWYTAGQFAVVQALSGGPEGGATGITVLSAVALGGAGLWLAAGDVVSVVGSSRFGIADGWWRRQPRHARAVVVTGLAATVPPVFVAVSGVSSVAVVVIAPVIAAAVLLGAAVWRGLARILDGDPAGNRYVIPAASETRLTTAPLYAAAIAAVVVPALTWPA